MWERGKEEGSIFFKLDEKRVGVDVEKGILRIQFKNHKVYILNER